MWSDARYDDMILVCNTWWDVDWNKKALFPSENTVQKPRPCWHLKQLRLIWAVSKSFFMSLFQSKTDVWCMCSKVPVSKACRSCWQERLLLFFFFMFPLSFVAFDLICSILSFCCRLQAIYALLHVIDLAFATTFESHLLMEWRPRLFTCTHSCSLRGLYGVIFSASVMFINRHSNDHHACLVSLFCFVVVCVSWFRCDSDISIFSPLLQVSIGEVFFFFLIQKFAIFALENQVQAQLFVKDWSPESKILNYLLAA